MRHRRLEGGLVDRDPAAGVAFQAAGFEAEILHRALAPGGEQHHVAAQLAPVVQETRQCCGLSTTAATARLPKRSVTPRSRRSWTNSSASSRSMNGSRPGLGSTMVTFTSRALKIEAYSTPITLAPTTMSWRGYG